MHWRRLETLLFPQSTLFYLRAIRIEFRLIGMTIGADNFFTMLTDSFVGWSTAPTNPYFVPQLRSR